MEKAPRRFELLSAALLAALSTIVTQPLRAQFLPGEIDTMAASIFAFLAIAAGYLCVLMPIITLKNKSISFVDFVLASFVMFAVGMCTFLVLQFLGASYNIEFTAAAQLLLYTFFISSMMVWIFGKIT